MPLLFYQYSWQNVSPKGARLFALSKTTTATTLAAPQRQNVQQPIPQLFGLFRGSNKETYRDKMKLMRHLDCLRQINICISNRLRRCAMQRQQPKKESHSSNSNHPIIEKTTTKATTAMTVTAKTALATKRMNQATIPTIVNATTNSTRKKTTSQGNNAVFIQNYSCQWTPKKHYPGGNNQCVQQSTQTYDVFLSFKKQKLSQFDKLLECKVMASPVSRTCFI